MTKVTQPPCPPGSSFPFCKYPSPCFPLGSIPGLGPMGCPAHPAMGEPGSKRKHTAHEWQESELRRVEGHGNRGRGELAVGDRPSQGSGWGQLEEGQKGAGAVPVNGQWGMDGRGQAVKSTCNIRPCTEDGFCPGNTKPLEWQEGPLTTLGCRGSRSPLLALPHSHSGP